MSRFFAAAEKAKSAPVEELEMKTPEEWAAARQKEKMLQLVQMLRGKGGYDICFAEWQANGFDPDRVPVLPYVSFEVQIYSYAAMCPAGPVIDFPEVKKSYYTLATLCEKAGVALPEFATSVADSGSPTALECSR